MTSIAVCAPIDQRSAVARSTLSFVSSLAKVADVAYFAEPTDRPFPCDVPVHPLVDDRSALEELADWQHVVLVIGNSTFHRITLDISSRLPATIILHDVSLVHVLEATRGFEWVRRSLGRYYGEHVMEAAGVALRHPDTRRQFEFIAAHPLLEPVLERATGVVVHSEFAAKALDGRAIAPIKVLALPGFETARPPLNSEALARFDGTQIISTIGHVNPNRHHGRVIQALAQLRERPRPVHYLVVGPVSERDRLYLERLAAALGVSTNVHLLGAVAPDELAAVLHRTDVSVVLREPALEGASASALESMAAGCATIVSDHASYAELPREVAVRVHPRVDAGSLATELQALLDDDERRGAIGRAARDHVVIHHHADGYARSLLDFVEQRDDWAPMRETALRIASITQSWGQRPSSLLPGRTARALVDLLGRRERG